MCWNNAAGLASSGRKRENRSKLGNAANETRELIDSSLDAVGIFPLLFLSLSTSNHGVNPQEWRSCQIK